MSTSSWRWVAPIAVPLTVWLCSIPLAEGVFRLLGGGPSPDLASGFCAFGDRGFKLQPNLCIRARSREGGVDLYTDDLGLRCPGDPAKRLPLGSGVNYLFLGDSQGFGNGVNYEDSFVGIVANRAQTRGWRAANGSVAAHYLRNQLDLAQWLQASRGLRIARVVLLVTPYLVNTAGSYNRAVVGDDGRLYSASPSRLALAIRWLGTRGGFVWVKNHTVLYGRLRDALSQTVRSAAKGAPVLVSFFRTERGPNGGVEALTQTLRGIQNGIGAKVDVVYTPLTVELDFSRVSEKAHQVGVSVDSSIPGEIARRAAEAVGCGFFDLRPTLAGVQAQGSPLSLQGDAHYSVPANAACAESIWGWLTAPK